MASNVNRFDYKYHSTGELVTAQKLLDMQTRVRDSLLDYMTDMYRRKTDALVPSTGNDKVPGVIAGMDYAAYSGTMQITIARGLCLTSVSDQAIPIPNEVAQTVTLTVGHPTDIRFDTVYARFLHGTANVASRSVRLAGGTLSTQNLPADYDEGCTIGFVTGTAGSGVAPAVPLTASDVPLFVVEVPATVTNTLACTIWDIRRWLQPHAGGVHDLMVGFHVDTTSGTPFTAKQAHSSCPMIKYADDLIVEVPGSIMFSVRVPSAQLGAPIVTLNSSATLVGGGFGVIPSAVVVPSGTVYGGGLIKEYAVVLSWYFQNVPPTWILVPPAAPGLFGSVNVHLSFLEKTA